MECGHDLNGPAEKPVVENSQPQSYTPKFLADKILTSHRVIEGERKLVTVLFADVANFTSISEKLDPEDAHEIIDGCFKILSQEIHQHEGTINQYTGDGVMALFGAPIAHEEHAQRACQAALAIQSSMVGYSSQIEREFHFEIKMRIGLNTGPVIVGRIGDDLRMDYTAVGDTTNLASRMETMAQPGRVLISENTQRLVKAYFKLKPFDPVEVKGKEKPQAVFELIESSEVKTRMDASISRGLTRFVGRKNSMVAVKSAWAKALRGFGQVLGIVGEAGVGKSRLLLEFRNSLPAGEFSYLEGRCFQYGGSMAFLPIVDILRSCFRIEEGLPEVAVTGKIKDKLKEFDEELLKFTLPAFQDLLSLRFEDESWLHLGAQEKRERAFEAIRNLLVSFSRNKPLVVAIEDLHWMDKTSEEFLTFFIDKLAHCRILLILLYRAEYTHQWGSKSYYSKIGLDQLTTESSAELISTILEGSEVGSDLKQLIIKQAAGHPLFIEEFTHSLWENGLIERQEDRFILSRKFKDVQVPDSIQGIIASRMDRLEGNLKRTLQVASVVGRDFAFRILQAASGMQEELKAHLLSLQGLEFIYEKQLLPELEYIFKHVLTQEVAYQSLLLKKRKKLHERIGQAIEQIYADRLEEYYEILAHHYAHSHNFESAFQYLKRSGQKAMRKNSTWEALDYYEKAIAVLERLPGNHDQKRKKLEVTYLTISPLIALGFPDKSLSILEQGERLAKDLADERRLFRFRTNIGFLYCTNGNYLEARPYIEQAFDASEKLHDIDLMGQVIPDLYTVYLAAGEHMKSVDVISDVIDRIEKNQRQKDFFGGPTNIYPTLHSFCGLSLGWTGNFKKALTFCEKGNLAATATNDARTLGLCDWLLGAVLLFKGELEPAKVHLESAVKYNEKLKHTPSLPLSYSWFGLASGLAGDSATGCRHAEKGLKIQSDTGYKYLGSIGWFCLGVCLAESGEFEAAGRKLEKGLEISRENHERVTEGAILIWLGRVLGQRFTPQYDRAAESILLGIEISKGLSHRPDEAVGYLFLVELYANQDRKDLVLEYLKKSMVLFEEMEMNYWPDKVRKILARLQ
jgi:class 3 adenylate cyclase/tetratricopeptide (TPR) repeat protein